MVVVVILVVVVVLVVVGIVAVVNAGLVTLLEIRVAE